MLSFHHGMRCHDIQVKLGLALLVVALSGAAAAQAKPVAVWRLNCGGPAMPAVYGPAFSGDQPYTAATHAGFVGGAANTWEVGNDLGALNDINHAQHGTARLGWTAYRFDVPNGEYLLRLHFAEIDKQVQGPGLRVFGVNVEGQPLLANFDVAAQYGVRFAAELVVQVHVADGHLDVEATGGSPAILNAVEVWTLPASVPAPAVTHLAAKDGYGRTIVSWDSARDPGVVGFLVERAPSAAGPWTQVATLRAAPSRFLDEVAPQGVPLWYRVRALGLGLSAPPTQGAPSVAGPAESHPPQDSALPVFELTIDLADIQLLDQMVLVDEEFEVPAVFTHEGRSQAVTVRYRGGGSLLASKKSWKIDFPDDALFEGRLKLNLKATFNDESLSIEPLAHDLFEFVGHEVTHQRRVHLEVNGVYKGVFNDIEQVDERYLAARDRDPGGSLYKAGENAIFQVLPTLEDYQATYEKKTNEATGYDDLVALIELLNDPDATILQLADVFDVEAYLSYVSVVGWDADSDQLSRNFYLLHDLSLGRWEWVTWDNDRAMNFPEAPMDGGTSTCEVCGGLNHLKNFVLSDPGMRWRYSEKLKALMASAASPAAMDAAIDAKHVELLADAHADTAKWGWERDALFDAAPGVLSDFVPARNAYILSELASYQPAQPPTAIWINELLADNVASATDEAGQHEDWVELYNADATPHDVGGLYLTDDLSDPTQWRLPDGTIVPGHGHLLVWCDDDAGDGPLHASFKLSAEGEELALVAADGATLLDVFDWRPQLPDVSIGRTTDGAPFFRLLPTPTPGAANTTVGNLPPLVTWVEHVPTLPLPNQPVTISAQVLDDEPPLAVTLWWRIGAAGAFSAVAMSPLEAHRWEATLSAQPAGTTVQYYLAAQDGLGAQVLEPTDAPSSLFTYTVVLPPPGALRINELMADNVSTLTDEAGSFEDWVEIANDSDVVRDLSGMVLSDDDGALKWEFPAGTLIGPHATLLVWCDEDPLDGPLHAAFKLSKSGESVVLFDTADNDHALLDLVAFGPQLSDVSTGLLPDGHGARVCLLDSSPGAPNVPAPGATRRYDALVPAATTSALSATSAPLPGQLYTLHVQGAPGSASGLLVIGLGTLHVNFGVSGVLLLNPLLSALLPFTTLPDGSATTGFKLPGNPALAGQMFEVQVYVAGSGLSNAVAGTIGS